MRIAFLTELFYPHMAGCERRFYEIGKRLARRGHEVHVFTLQHDVELPKEEIVEGIFVHRCTHSSNYITRNGFRSINGVLKYSIAASMRLLGEKFDVYYCNQWPMIHTLFARPFASPLVQEWCEVWTSSLKIKMLQAILKQMSVHHVAVSEFTARRLTHLLGIEPKQVSIVPNGVDYSKFCADSKTKSPERITYVGRLFPHKHAEMVIEAFRRVKEKAPDAELHVIGSGPCLRSIKNQATGLEECFIHGFLPEGKMMGILKTSSLLVFPSEREGSGIVALEAMASGAPVITTDFPDNAAKELVDGMNGLVVAPTVDAIAEAVLTLLSSEKLWYKMSHHARFFAKQYDWDQVSAEFEGVLKEVAS